VGTGISFAALGTHPGVSADGVELSPEVAVLQSAFSPHNDHGPQLRLHVADARRFVRASAERYDVIIADLFHPARDGAGGLYTREHFEAIRARLADGGMFCQWLPLFQLDLPTLQTITATFLSVFPDANALLLRPNADTPVLGLIGGTGPLRVDPTAVEQRLSEPLLREALRPLALAEIWPVVGSWFADSTWLRSLSRGAGINTDDHPIILFQAPHTVARVAVPGQTLLARLLEYPRPVSSALFHGTTLEWNQRFVDYLSARDAYLKGVIAEADGDPARAEAAFWDSLGRSRDFTSGYAQLISRATAQARTDPNKARRMLEQLSEARPDLKVAQELRRRLAL
jgi:spermidine synthase